MDSATPKTPRANTSPRGTRGTRDGPESRRQRNMYKAPNSNNQVVADVTIYEMQRLKRGETTDYSKAMQWLRELKVYVKLVASGSKATSTNSFRHNPTEYSEAYLFKDASEQLWWGAAYLLVSGAGEILA